MNRNTLIGLCALAVVAAGAALYYGLRPIPTKAPGSSTVTTTLTDPYVEHGAYYDITAAYPTTTPLAVAANEAAINAMQGWVIETASTFKADTHAENPSPEDVRAMGFDQGRKVSLTVTYHAFSAPHTVSYVFTTYTDTGGAHGNTSFTTFTFDTTTHPTNSGQTSIQLALADLFSPNSGYLDKLSSIARAKLPDILGNDANKKMIGEGTAPEAKNFSSWYLDGPSLVLLFPPYAVASYADGPQMLTIPLVDLSASLSPAYRP